MPQMTQKDERTRFERRCQATLAGRRVPTVDELLRLGPLYFDSLDEDIQAFAARAATAIKYGWPEAENLRTLLQSLGVAPWKEVLQATLAALQALPEGAIRNKDRDDFERRLKIYGAYMGISDHIRYVADLCFERALLDRSKLTVVDMLRAFLGWQTALFHRSIWNGRSDWYSSREKVYDNGESAIESLGRYWIEKTAPAQKQPDPDEPVPEPKTAASDNSGDRIIVVREVGNAVANAKVANEFKGIAGRSLPLLKTPDLRQVRSTLSAEFPYALQIVDTVLNDLLAHRHVRMRPTVLLGSPGCGKTLFWQRLLELLGSPFTVFSCGGVSDSSLAGTARRWSSGEPSMPLNLVRQHQIANPAIVLDEIEKAGTSNHNGNLLDALLSFLEPLSAAAYYDPYLQAPVNLSAFIWCATANTVHGMPKPLRDRMRILRFPSPKKEHLEYLALALMEDIARDRGHRVEWLRPLTAEEIDALRAVWPGGSVRQLRRYLEGVLAAREAVVARH